jgi:succinyl-CoA synthetase alpha subunit
VSRSGTLTYQALQELSRNGIGQTTCVGIGGDAIPGVGFIECLRRFEDDAETRAVILIGEIGGTEEEDAATYISSSMTKPVLAYVAGLTAPPGRRMGHAGAIISGRAGGAAAKVEALRAGGAEVVDDPTALGARMAELLAAMPAPGAT